MSFVVDDGEVNWELTFVARINDLQAAQSIIGSSLTNILDMYNEKLYLDSLTNTYNRRYYDEKLKGLETANGAAMLDIDDFKSINDTYGHTVGDIVLTKVASAIKGLIRNSDAVVRYGGDEFFILFWNIPKDVLLTKLEIIKKRIEEIAIEGHPDLKVSASIGAVHHVDATEALLIEADKNLYIAKKDKNNVIM
ncbi:MAG: GGDEF domain-containing protein [Eubacterium sp.]|nr:GGDEF domain-containing protein [Candidatus Colimonas fimequi]